MAMPSVGLFALVCMSLPFFLFFLVGPRGLSYILHVYFPFLSMRCFLPIKKKKNSMPMRSRSLEDIGC